MKVNYMVELNRLNRWEMTNPLNPTEYKLLLKLLDMANTEEFPEEIRVSSSLLKALVGCSEASLRRARQRLVACGRIACRANHGEAAIYALNYFSASNAAFYDAADEQPDASRDTSRDECRGASCDGSPDASYDGSSDGENRENATVSAVSSYTYKTRPEQTKPDQNEEEVYPTIREDARAGSGKDRRLREMAAYIVETHPTFAAEREAFAALIADRRYDAQTVMEALDRTEKRCEREKLESPRAYFVALLADWRNRQPYCFHAASRTVGGADIPASSRTQPDSSPLPVPLAAAQCKKT